MLPFLLLPLCFMMSLSPLKSSGLFYLLGACRALKLNPLCLRAPRCPSVLCVAAENPLSVRFRPPQREHGAGPWRPELVTTASLHPRCRRPYLSALSSPFIIRCRVSAAPLLLIRHRQLGSSSPLAPGAVVYCASSTNIAGMPLNVSVRHLPPSVRCRVPLSVSSGSQEPPRVCGSAHMNHRRRHRPPSWI